MPIDFDRIESLVDQGGELTAKAPRAAKAPTSWIGIQPSAKDQAREIVAGAKDIARQRLRVGLSPEEPEERSVLGELAASVKRGLTGATEMIARSQRTPTIGAIGTLKGVAEAAGLDRPWDDKVVSAVQGLQEKWAPHLEPTKHGKVWDAINQGIESTVESVIGAAPGLSMGGVPAIAGTAGLVFSLSEYDSFMEEAQKAGIPKDSVKKEAFVAALAEGGIEAATDLMAAKVFGFLGTKKVAKEATKGLLRSFGRFIGNVAKVGSFEVPGEMVTGAVQAGAREHAGVPTATPREAAMQAVGPSIVQTILMGGLGAGAQRIAKKPGLAQEEEEVPPDVLEIEKKLGITTEEVPGDREEEGRLVRPEREGEEPGGAVQEEGPSGTPPGPGGALQEGEGGPEQRIKEWGNLKDGDTFPDEINNRTLQVVKKGIKRKYDARKLVAEGGGEVWRDTPKTWAVVREVQQQVLAPEAAAPPPSAQEAEQEVSEVKLQLGVPVVTPGGMGSYSGKVGGKIRVDLDTGTTELYPADQVRIVTRDDHAEAATDELVKKKPKEASETPPESTLPPAGPETPATPVAPTVTAKPTAAKAKKGPTSIISWVRDKGGLWDESVAGEIKALMEEKAVGLVRKQTGKTLDDLAASAVEEGVLPQGSTANDLYESLVRDIRYAKEPLKRPPTSDKDVEKAIAEGEEEMIARAEGAVQEISTGEANLKVGDRVRVPTKDGMGEEWLEVTAHDPEKNMLTLQDGQEISIDDTFGWLPTVGGQDFGIQRKEERKYTAETLERSLPKDIQGEERQDLIRRLLTRSDEEIAALLKSNLEQYRREQEQKKKVKASGAATPIEMFPEEVKGQQDIFGQQAKQETPAKEPWEMTHDEYLQSLGMDERVIPPQPKREGARMWRVSEDEVITVGAHEYAVRQALKEGKPVPPGVLAEYPGLMKGAEKPVQEKPQEPLDELTQDLERKGAGRVNDVDYKILKRDDGTFYYSRTKGGVRIEKGQVGPVKGIGWSREEAIRRAVEDARGEIGEEVATKPVEEKPAPAEPQEYKKGDRVVITSGSGKDRHGTISDVYTFYMTPLIGGAGAISKQTTYTVTTDAGSSYPAVDNQLSRETGEAPDYIPDILIDDRFYEPEYVAESIRRFKDLAERKREAERRARTTRAKVKYHDEAKASDESAKEYQRAFDEWAAKFPEEAAKYRKEEVPAPSPTPAPAAAPPAKATGITVTENKAKGGIEIKFDKKPADEVIERISRAGFRWSRRQRLWYAKHSPERLRIAQEIAGATTKAPAAEPGPDLEVTGQGKPLPGHPDAQYVVHRRKPDLIPHTYRVIIKRLTPWLSVDGTGMTAREAYDNALADYERKAKPSPVAAETKGEVAAQEPKQEIPRRFEIGDYVVPAPGSGLHPHMAGTVQHIRRDSNGVEWIKTTSTGNMHFKESDWVMAEKPEKAFPVGTKVVTPKGPGIVYKAPSPSEAAQFPDLVHVELAGTKEQTWYKAHHLTVLEEEASEEGLEVLGPAEEEGVAPATATAKLAKMVKEAIKPDAEIKSSDLFEWANEAFGGTQAEGKYVAKDAYDAMELGINQYIDESLMFSPILGDLKYPRSQVLALKKIVGMFPTHARRTTEQTQFQQFSTPPPLAYVANWAANIRQGETYLEPSAGIGGLAVFGKKADAKVIVNELSERRLAILKELGFDEYYQENAEQLDNILPPEVKPSVIVMNPPFSATGGRVERNKTEYGARHVEQALERLQEGGRLVAIVGRGMADSAPSFRAWWDKIKGKYNVRVNIQVSGDEYKKYGTTFDNQLVVIDKTGQSTGTIITGRVEKIEDLIPLIQEVRNDRQSLPPESQAAEQPAGEPALLETPPASETVTAGGMPSRRPTGAVGGGERPVEPGRPPGGRPGQPVSGGPGTGGAGARPEKHAETGGAARPGEGGPGVTPRLPPGEPGRVPEGERGAVEPPGESVEQLEIREAEQRQRSGELSDSIFDDYEPQIVATEARKHPAKLVQSAAMSDTLLPKTAYKPRIPQETIKAGRLSGAQIEAVSYAGHAHSEILPDGTRKGFFIGDGTGVGKGREIAGVIWDNWNQGRRKAVWISESAKLIDDAARDLKGVGFTEGAEKIFSINKTKLGNDIQPQEGILFSTYATLRKNYNDIREDQPSSFDNMQVRINQIVKWLGKDFDGALVFDESHNMANITEQKTERGARKPSQQALAGVLLQKLLPKARVLYVSATGATEVENLAYAPRLGLWGEGTAFSDVRAFIGEMNAGGLGAMEQVARDMKAMGLYVSRNLSWEDVNTERLSHDLTPEQRGIYDELAGAWQIVLANIADALETTGATSSGHAKKNVYGAFWNANQRFFNAVLCSMQMPTVLQQVHKDIEAGYSVVLQLTNTGEAMQERAFARMEEGQELEDLDMTPREQLMQYLQNAFPVQQYEQYTDENGNTKSRPVYDSKGNPVLNAAAVRQRDDLMAKLSSIRVPASPLDMILDEFGSDVVAEVTGRSRRIVYDKKQGKKVEQRWGDKRANADAEAFMDDKKLILVFSEKGGTGRSYHADLDRKNQRLRRHYLLQPGWRAMKAIQGLGRSHRSNQKQAPEFILVHTDLPGHKRFISTIARRLDQLGAITKGQRQTGSHGIFQARDNLENRYAADALRRFIGDIQYGRSPHFDVQTFQQQTGLKIVDDKGSAIEVNIPVKQFLNRLLSMNIEYQHLAFNAFSAELDLVVQAAAEAGRLDIGIETIRGNEIKKVSEKTVYTDKKTGAETKLVELDVTNPADLLSFQDAERKFGSAGQFARNIKSGRVWLASPMRMRTEKGGNVIGYFGVISPGNTHQSIDAVDFKNKEKWEIIDRAQAKALWDKEYGELPKKHTRRFEIIRGTLLPIWDKLGAEFRIYRMQTDEGERIIGRVIGSEERQKVFENLGVEGKKIEMTGAQIAETVLQGGTVRLSNNWKFKQSRVSGESRIELTGPGFYDRNTILGYGVFEERIDWSNRYFVPVGNQASKVIDSIMKYRDIASVEKAYTGPRLPGGEGPQFSLQRRRDYRKLSDFLTLDDVHEIFPGQAVGLTKDGNVWVQTRKGHGLVIKSAKEIAEDKVSIEAAYGRQREDGEMIVGKYKDGTITIRRDLADKWTLAHESTHWMEDAGILSPMDVAILKAHVNKLHRQGKWTPTNPKDIGGAEDRANLIADLLQGGTPKGALRKIAAKIRDWIDRLVNLATRTAAGVARDIQTGRIFEGEPGEATGTGTPAFSMKREVDGEAGEVSDPPSLTENTKSMLKDMRNSRVAHHFNWLRGRQPENVRIVLKKEYGPQVAWWVRNMETILSQLPQTRAIYEASRKFKEQTVKQFDVWRARYEKAVRNLNEREKRIALNLLDTTEDITGTRPAEKAAAAIREILRDVREYLIDNGHKVGFIEGYLPHIFQGEFWVKAKGEMSEKVKTIGEALQIAEQMAQATKKPVTIMQDTFIPPDDAQMLNQRSYWRLVKNLQKQFGDEVPIFEELSMADVHKMLREGKVAKPLPRARFFGHQMKRAINNPHFIRDLDTVMNLFFYGASRKVSQDIFMRKVQRNLEALPSEASDLRKWTEAHFLPGVLAHPTAFEKGVARAISATVRPGTTGQHIRQWLHNVNIVQYVLDLGYSASSAVANASQFWMNAYPIVGERVAAKSYAQAAKIMVKLIRSPHRLTEADIKLLEEIDEAGVTSSVSSITGEIIIDRGIWRQWLEKIKLKEGTKGFMEASLMPFSTVELYNRVSTYLAGKQYAMRELERGTSAAEIARKAAPETSSLVSMGKEIDARLADTKKKRNASWRKKTARMKEAFARKTGFELNEKANFRVGRENLPFILREAPVRLFSPYKTFLLNQLRYTIDTYRGSGPGWRRLIPQDPKRALRFTAIAFGAAGAKANPILYGAFLAASSLLKWLFGYDMEREVRRAEWMRGIPGKVGLDISGSVAVNLPATGKDLLGRFGKIGYEVLAHAFDDERGAGPLAMTERRAGEIVRQATPSQARRIVDALTILEEGVYRTPATKTPVALSEEPWIAATKRFLGMMPTDVARTFEEEEVIKRKQRRYKSLSRDLTERWTEALRTDDRREMERVAAYVANELKRIDGRLKRAKGQDDAIEAVTDLLFWQSWVTGRQKFKEALMRKLVPRQVSKVRRYPGYLRPEATTSATATMPREEE